MVTEVEYVTKSVRIHAWVTELPIFILTDEGIMYAAPGTFIIRGLRGEAYPCLPDVFWAKYEVAQ